VAEGGHHALDPLVVLAVAAAATTRIGLHTNGFVAGYRNPFVAAKGVATLDALSQGRVILGMAAGYLDPATRARPRRLRRARRALRQGGDRRLTDPLDDRDDLRTCRIRRRP
jgi:alkanesulfonate monooxygenase SsuD/methylene tetrahydromethanopterin reductase-like flavin-dependent oxidoreductase (luciferase family)